MSDLNLVPIKVTQRAGADAGKDVMALLAVCPDCKAEVWHVYQILDQQHFHLQCHHCGLTLCPEGACVEGQ
jgi:hypothetical protein